MNLTKNLEKLVGPGGPLGHQEYSPCRIKTPGKPTRRVWNAPTKLWLVRIGEEIDVVVRSANQRLFAEREATIRMALVKNTPRCGNFVQRSITRGGLIAHRRHGIAVPKKSTQRAKKYVARKISQAIRRGAKTIDRDSYNWCRGNLSHKDRLAIRKLRLARLDGVHGAGGVV